MLHSRTEILWFIGSRVAYVLMWVAGISVTIYALIE